jgi:hypothetical protein
MILWFYNHILRSKFTLHILFHVKKMFWQPWYYLLAVTVSLQHQLTNESTLGLETLREIVLGEIGTLMPYKCQNHHDNKGKQKNTTGIRSKERKKDDV